MALSAVLLGLAIVAGGLIYIRAVGHDPTLWHVDPVLAERTGRPNDATAAPDGADVDAPVLALERAAVAERMHAVALAQPRVSVVAGDPAEGFVTYVQRSRWIGWPDYVSVRTVEAGQGASVAAWSRSRFGYSDLGVNRKRLERWMAALAAQG